MSVGAGGQLSELVETCRPLRNVKPGPEATNAFLESRLKLAQRVEIPFYQ